VSSSLPSALTLLVYWGSVIPTTVSDSLAAPLVRPAHHHGAVSVFLTTTLAVLCPYSWGSCYSIASRYAHVLLAHTSFTNKQTSLADSPLTYHVQNLGTHALHASKAHYQHQGWQYPWLRPIWTIVRVTNESGCIHQPLQMRAEREQRERENDQSSGTYLRKRAVLLWSMRTRMRAVRMRFTRQAQPVWQVFMM